MVSAAEPKRPWDPRGRSMKGARATDGAIVMLITLVFVSTSPSFELFHANQHTYFPHGLLLAGRDFLATDWFANTAALHGAFSLLVAALDSVNLLEVGVALATATLDVAFLYGLWLVMLSLNDRDEPTRDAGDEGSRATASLVALAVFVAVVNRVAIPSQGGMLVDLVGVQGLAGQSVRFGYLQPSEFGCLAVLAVGLLQRGCWSVAGAALGVATLFNASLALPCAVFLAAAWYGARELAPSLGPPRSAFLWFALLGTPSVLRAVGLGFGAGSDEAVVVLARERIAHHALPEVWWNATEAARLAVMAAGTGLIFLRTRGPLRYAMVAGLALVVAGTALVAATGSERLGLLFPWRASTVLYPICLAALVAGAMRLVVRPLSGSRAEGALRVALVLVLCGGVVLGARAKLASRAPGERNAVDGFAEEVRAMSSDVGVVLVPPSWQWQSFRLLAERPVFVDVKNHPYAPADVMEWRARVERARRFQRGGPEDRQFMCAELGVDSYVIAARRRRAGEEPVLIARGYALVRCPRPATDP